MKFYSKTDDIEMAQKRRKNADAQAAFRKRCAAYYKGLQDVIKQLDDRPLVLQGGPILHLPLEKRRHSSPRKSLSLTWPHLARLSM
jgi:hypothetical protein